MTLILMTGRSGSFVAMTGDKRKITVDSWYNPKTGEIEVVGKPKIDENPVNNKVVKLSAYALMGAGGKSDICIYLRDAMLELVEEGDDLAECAKKLQKIIDEARNKLHENSWFPLLNQENGAIIIVAGFYSDNTSGIVSFESGLDSQVRDIKVPLESAYWSLIPPSKQYSKMGNVLMNVSPFDKRFFNSNMQRVSNENEVWKTIYTDQMKWFHNIVAQNQPTEVSKDGFLHSLVLGTDGMIQYNVEEFGI